MYMRVAQMEGARRKWTETVLELMSYALLQSFSHTSY